MSKHLVILGGGTAGLIMANLMRRRLPAAEWRMTVVDRSDTHLYQPGLLFLPFEIYQERHMLRDTRDYVPKGADFTLAEVDRVVPAEHRVKLKDGRVLGYDVLVVATGCRTAPEETAGLLGPGWRNTVHDFYTLDGSRALRDKLALWPGGRLVVHVNEMPIKCPVAPLEFTFLADDFFRRKLMRDKVTLTYVTPLSGAFTKPKAAKKLGHLLADKGIDLVTDFVAERVDQEKRRIICYDGREVPYDLLVTVPTNMGDAAIQRSGLGDDLGYLATNKHTLQSAAHPDIFVIGDATNLPASKAGSVAHFESETLAENILRHIHGQPLKEEFDGHSNCFIESGNGKALLIDFNYEQEPHEGRFPFAFGPLPLLKESHLNHWAKHAFRLIYWHVLLRGRRIPGISRVKKAPAIA